MNSANAADVRNASQKNALMLQYWIVRGGAFLLSTSKVFRMLP